MDNKKPVEVGTCLNKDKKKVVEVGTTLNMEKNKGVEVGTSLNLDKKKVVCRPYDKIKDVNESKDLWTFSVRIADAWSVMGKSRQEHFDMVVVDKQSDSVQITVPTDELDEWKGKLVKNKTYEMMNFKVLKNDIVLKACTHPYRLAVTGATIIKEVDFPQIPIFPMRFKDFGEILAGKYRTDLLTVTNTNQYKGRLKSVTFLLKDTSGHLVHVCMFDDFAKHFMDSFSKVNDDRVFVVVKRGRIKPAHGVYPLCVTNTWSGTELIVNADIPEINEFKARFAEEQLDDVNPTQQSSQFSQGSQLTQQTDIMSKVNFLTLSEVNHVQHETVCVSITKIEKINANKFGWTYDGCNFCGKVVHLDNGELKCTSNHINEKPKARYRIEVQAIHKDVKARFLLWDNEVTSIVGISAEDLKEEMIEVGQFHPKLYPPALDKLVCKEFFLKIKAIPGMNPCIVSQISDNEQLLTNLRKQFGLEEVSSKLAIGGQMSDADKQISDADNKDVEIDHTQSLCGENDPSSTSATPPPKRLSQDEVDWIASSQDVEATQLSSTKLAKQPKPTKQPKLEPKN
ncbi:uncharacterized protein [Medicago truncatula]|uniref:uncharacterized protein n=1 Tax=Medicago truncatula TaxID=3880 RepID=UPI00196841E2|nr:uncharacterized protein LOC112418548 [Medicago truncatula]